MLTQTKVNNISSFFLTSYNLQGMKLKHQRNRPENREEIVAGAENITSNSNGGWQLAQMEQEEWQLGVRFQFRRCFVKKQQQL